MNSNECGDAVTLRIFVSDKMAGPFWSNHKDIDAFIRNNLAKMDIKPMGKGKICAFFKILANLILVKVSLKLVRHKYHNHIGLFYSPRYLHYLQTRCLCLF